MKPKPTKLEDILVDLDLADASPALRAVLEKESRESPAVKKATQAINALITSARLDLAQQIYNLDVAGDDWRQVVGDILRGADTSAHPKSELKGNKEDL